MRSGRVMGGVLRSLIVVQAGSEDDIMALYAKQGKSDIEL